MVNVVVLLVISYAAFMAWFKTEDLVCWSARFGKQVSWHIDLGCGTAFHDGGWDGAIYDSLLLFECVIDVEVCLQKIAFVHVHNCNE